MTLRRQVQGDNNSIIALHTIYIYNNIRIIIRKCFPHMRMNDHIRNFSCVVKNVNIMLMTDFFMNYLHV